MNITDREESEKKFAFQNMQDELYNKDEIKEHLDFIKDECIEGWSSEAEKERIDEAIEAIKNASKEIKGYNDFVKYLAVFSKIDLTDTEAMLNLFKIFYKTFKGKEIDLDVDEENLKYYEGIDTDAVVEFYEETSKKLSEKTEKELPADFYDDKEIEQVVFAFLIEEKSNEEREEYKKMMLSKIIQYYSHPAIFYNKDVLARAVLFNYYYLVYKVLNSEAFKNEVSKKKQKIRKEHKKYEKEEKEKKKKEKELNSKYHIKKTILILLFLAFLLLFGTAGKILAVLILLYYGIKGMLRDENYIDKDDLEGIKEQLEAEILTGEKVED